MQTLKEKTLSADATTSVFSSSLRRSRNALTNLESVAATGRLTRVVGMRLEATGCKVPLGGRCWIERSTGPDVEAQVVGFSGASSLLMPVSDLTGVLPNAKVRPSENGHCVSVGDSLLGRVVDARGYPIDEGGEPSGLVPRPLNSGIRNPLDRPRVSEALDVGVQSINALLSIGRGQRIGVFASAGAGKSALLGMMTRDTEADVVGVGLIGERGREVQDFIEESLGPQGRARSVVVAVPADNPPLLRLQGAMLATTIAEFFCAQGKRVLLLMDSLTRFAQAQREIGLAVGEPPTTKGYPPSVFAKLPALVERAGTSAESGGSITAFYTVLTEGDAELDPIAQSARAILDGHIVLSTNLANAGHYPAIDVSASVSRVMNQIVDDGHLKAARRFRELCAVYEEHRDLITVGAYERGADPLVDLAITHRDALMGFLRQDINESRPRKQSIDALMAMYSAMTTQPVQPQGVAPA